MYNKLFQDKAINKSGPSRISPEREQIEKIKKKERGLKENNKITNCWGLL
jgi:hypothetical protein